MSLLATTNVRMTIPSSSSSSPSLSSRYDYALYSLARVPALWVAKNNCNHDGYWVPALRRAVVTTFFTTNNTNNTDKSLSPRPADWLCAVAFCAAPLAYYYRLRQKLQSKTTKKSHTSSRSRRHRHPQRSKSSKTSSKSKKHHHSSSKPKSVSSSKQPGQNDGIVTEQKKTTKTSRRQGDGEEGVSATNDESVPKTKSKKTNKAPIQDDSKDNIDATKVEESAPKKESDTKKKTKQKKKKQSSSSSNSSKTKTALTTTPPTTSDDETTSIPNRNDKDKSCDIAPQQQQHAALHETKAFHIGDVLDIVDD